MNLNKKILVAMSALACGSAASFGAILPPNTTIFPAPLVAPVLGAPVDGVVASLVTDPPTVPTFTGSVISTVVNEGVLNPLGGLTFTYTLSNDPTSADAIDHLTINGFAGLIIDVGYVAGPGVAPVYVDRSGDDVVAFNWTAPLDVTAGAFTPELVIRTNSPVYVPSSVAAIDNSTAHADSFSPAPEPASLGLLGMGGLLLLRRRK